MEPTQRLALLEFNYRESCINGAVKRRAVRSLSHRYT